MRSTERLAQALEALNDPRLESMIKLARGGYYSDYGSPLDFPEMQLVADLRGLGLTDMAQRTINGEFDGTPEESDEWARSPEGQATFRELMGGPPS